MKSHGRLQFVFLRLKDARLHFTEKVTGAIRSFRSTPHNSQKSPLQNIYHQCRETSLSRFIDCVVDHNLQSLVKYGRPCNHLLQQAWDELYQEYCDLSGGSSYKTLVSLANDIAMLDRKYTHIRICLLTLSERDSLICANKLRQFGYKYEFSWSNPDQMRHDLDRVMNKSQVLQVVLQQKVHQREALLANQPKGGAIDRAYFDKVLVDLWKFQGARLDPNIISVMEYCHIKKNYEREIEYLNNQASAYKGKK